MALSRKHSAFVDEYLRLFNGTRAYMRVYPNTNERAASVSSTRLLATPGVKEEIERRFLLRQEETRKQIALFGVQKIRGKASFVYLIRATNGLVKIGKTTDVDGRFNTLNTASPIDLTLIASFSTVFADEIEEKLHSFYSDKRIKGEWFALTEDDIQEIKNEFDKQT